PNIATNVGYGAGRGASNISGGPYHVKMDNWEPNPNGIGTYTTEGNIGNLDNQLQGADIILVPTCNITGNTNICAGAGTQTYNAHPGNLDGATFQWSFTSNTSPTAATFSGTTTDSVVSVIPGS